MSLEITPYADRRRQPTVAVVTGNPEELRYISNDGTAREGDPETLWRELAQREKYTRLTMSRGKLRARTVDGSPPIIVAAKRGSIRDLVRTCDARHWEGLRSTHGKYKTLVHDGGPTVRRLGVTADLEPAADGLFTFVEFCNSHGVRFNGSIAGAGLSLFRTTLVEPIRFWAPPQAIDALWPGRREYWHEPKRWYEMAYFDLKAAYPAALKEDGIPTHWHQIDPLKWQEHKDGFSYARTYTPSSNPLPNPLPMRLRPGSRRESISWASGAFRGTYPHRDLTNALSVDTWVTPEETWVPTRYTDAFASPAWQALRAEMRALPGLAGTLGKMADNGLWGMFAFDNSEDIRVRWRTRDGDMSKSIEQKKVGVRKVHGIGVALAATARVRQSLWEGIRQTDAIYCDTDGMIAPDTATPYPNSGTDGTWILKDKLGVLDVKAPQVYRWLNLEDFDWHYLGESAVNFKTAPITNGQRHGDDMGTAPAMSVRIAHIRKLLDGSE
jgi:hypothetical protein